MPEEIRYPGLASFVRQETRPIWWYARLLDPDCPVQDIEDRVQETFVRVTAKWPLENPAAYARKIVKNITVDQWRRKRTRPETPDSLDGVEIQCTEPGPLELTLSSEGAQVVWRIVRPLPDVVQRVFVLHYVQDMSIAEVAESLGLTERRTYYYRNKIRGAIRGTLFDTEESEDPETNAP